MSGTTRCCSPLLPPSPHLLPPGIKHLHVFPFVSQFCLMAHDMEVGLAEGLAAVGPATDYSSSSSRRGTAAAAAESQEQEEQQGEAAEGAQQSAAAAAAATVRHGECDSRPAWVGLDWLLLVEPADGILLPYPHTPHSITHSPTQPTFPHNPLTHARMHARKHTSPLLRASLSHVPHSLTHSLTLCPPQTQTCYITTCCRWCCRVWSGWQQLNPSTANAPGGREGAVVPTALEGGLVH